MADDRVYLWQQTKDICAKIDAKHNPENDLSNPEVTNVDMLLKDALWKLTCFCEALRERVQELEQRESARMQLEEEERLRE